MKILIMLIGLVFLSTMSVVAQDASAIVKFEKEVIDLGKINKGDKINNQFVFTNVSSGDVEIDIVSTCDCTLAKWTSGIIKSGEQSTIDFVFDSSKKDDEVPIDVDVYFVNTNPENGNPYSVFLQYVYEFE